MITDQTAYKKTLLSSVWLFKDLPTDVIDQLVLHLRAETYPQNKVIVSKGDMGTSMMIIAEGRVKIGATFWAGREMVFNIMDSGEVFGEIALLDGRERTADAIAMEKTVLYVLERRDLLPVLRRNPEVGIRMLSLLCERFRWVAGQVEDAQFLEHPIRLAKVFLWLAERYGRVAPDGIAIEISLSQRELGAFVGVRREAMNRQLGAWREEGLIDVKDGTITLLKKEAFEFMTEMT